MTNKILLAVALLSQVSPETLLAQRTALSIEPLSSLQHGPTKNGYRTDPVTGKITPFALDGRIDFQPSNGNFRLSWDGIDGTRQQVEYEPPADESFTYPTSSRDHDRAGNDPSHNPSNTDLVKSKPKLRVLRTHFALLSTCKSDR